MIQFIMSGWTKDLSSLLAVGTYYKWNYLILLAEL